MLHEWFETYLLMSVSVQLREISRIFTVIKLQKRFSAVLELTSFTTSFANLAQVNKDNELDRKKGNLVDLSYILLKTTLITLHTDFLQLFAKYRNRNCVFKGSEISTQQEMIYTKGRTVNEVETLIYIFESLFLNFLLLSCMLWNLCTPLLLDISN